ncbi:hypothetical protein [Solirhodobacter olei]|uniref:hypothetical protein n=1 Tax=Solirhodobacter olei TaxID=2493082 RepID=UPI000FDA1A55|nr:hypothetical protein [Solirhodobacter olei]
MSKHLIDRPRGGEGDRVKPYLEIERSVGGPGAREKALHRGASTGRDPGQRMREFLRIERAQRAEAE